MGHRQEHFREFIYWKWFTNFKVGDSQLEIYTMLPFALKVSTLFIKELNQNVSFCKHQNRQRIIQCSSTQKRFNTKEVLGEIARNVPLGSKPYYSCMVKWEDAIQVNWILNRSSISMCYLVYRIWNSIGVLTMRY